MYYHFLTQLKFGSYLDNQEFVRILELLSFLDLYDLFFGLVDNFYVIKIFNVAIEICGISNQKFYSLFPRKLFLNS